jgi:uncharacterized membrane protein
VIVLRYLYVVALVLWVGGLVVAGALVAPSVFGVLEAWNESQGRALAGQVFGEVLLRLTWLSYAMGGIMFIALTLHRLLGARPVKYGVRVGIMGVMLVMMMVTGFVLIPQIDAIRAEVKGAVAELPDTDPRRNEFNRLHGLSNMLFSITAIGGLALCWWEARE